MRTAGNVLTVCLMLFILSACTTLPSPTADLSPVVAPPTAGILEMSNPIAYVSMRNGHHALYVTSSDGAQTYPIFSSHDNQIFDGGQFSWSPAAGQLAVSTIGTDRVDINTIRLDGGDLLRVTGKLLQGGTDPVWSPDGRRLLFACTGQSPQICAIDPDGSDLADLTSATGAQSAVSPSWAPDGRRIVYQSNRSGLPGIHVMDADGSHEARLEGGVSSSSQNSRPSWSPDGKRVLFQSDRDGRWQVYAMDASGDQPVNVSKGEVGSDVDGAWSPDGNKIAFRSDRTGVWNLFVANADGTDAQNVTSALGSVLSFSWSPDSRYIAFASDATGNGEIYAVDLENQETVNISNNPAADFAPLWISVR